MSSAPSVQINDNLRCKFYSIVEKAKHNTKINKTISFSNWSLIVDCNVDFDVIDYELLLWLVHKWSIEGKKSTVTLSIWEICKLKGIRTEQNNCKNIKKRYEDLLTLKLTFIENGKISIYDFNGSYQITTDMNYIDINVNKDMQKIFTEHSAYSVKVYIDQSMKLKSQLSKELYWHIQLNCTVSSNEKNKYKLRGITLSSLLNEFKLNRNHDTIKKLKKGFKELSEKTNYPLYTFKTNGPNDLFFRPTKLTEDFV